MQLQEHLDQFRAAGIGVVAITYDSEPLQQAFVDRFDIGYTILSDIDATSMSALGILNADQQPGDSAYGIPYPGAFVVDRDLVVRAKIFIAGYETRVDAEGTLAAAKAALSPGVRPPVE